MSAVSVNEKSPVNIGLLTLPFKARPQDDFSFDTEFNLNTTLSITPFQRNNYSLSVQLGAGIGSVGLNSNNSRGVMEDESQDAVSYTHLTLPTNREV